MDDLKILVIEDDETECKELTDAISRRKGFTLTGATGDSGRALMLCSANPPDVVILDLELHKGGGDGLSFLKGLKTLRLPKLPYVVVTTYNIDKITHTAVRNSGAGFIIIKTQEGYGAEYVLNYIDNVQSVLAVMQSETAVTSADPDICAKQLKIVISDEMLHMGFKPKNKGYKYVCDAILAVMEAPDASGVKIVADAHEKSKESVSRAIQKEIDRVFTRGNREYIYSRYTALIDKDRGAPTAKDFICFFAETLKNEIL